MAAKGAMEAIHKQEINYQIKLSINIIKYYKLYLSSRFNYKHNNCELHPQIKKCMKMDIRKKRRLQNINSKNPQRHRY